MTVIAISIRYGTTDLAYGYLFGAYPFDFGSNY